MKVKEGNNDRHLKEIIEIYTEKEPINEFIHKPILYYQTNIFRSDLFRILYQNGLLEKIPKGKLLDLGCGRGFHSRVFLDFGMNPENYFGVDITESMLSTARSILPTANYLNMSADNLSFNNATFDLILIFRLFTSIHDKNFRDAVFNEAMRVLKPDGSILYWDVIPPPPVYRYFIRLYGIFQNLFISKKQLSLENNCSKVKKWNWIRPLAKSEVLDSMCNYKVNTNWKNTGIRHELANQLMRFPIILEIIRRIRVPFFCNSILGVIRKDVNQNDI